MGCNIGLDQPLTLDYEQPGYGYLRGKLKVNHYYCTNLQFWVKEVIQQPIQNC